MHMRVNRLGEREGVCAQAVINRHDTPNLINIMSVEIKIIIQV